MAKKPAKTAKSSILDELKGYYQFMVDQKLESLEYDHQGTHVRLVRQRTQGVQVPVPIAVPVGAVAGAPAAVAAPATMPHHAHAASAVAAGAVTVKAPMMGIFYRANSPSSPPFCKQGDKVKKGQVLCLIEAMKVFNEVKADYDCSVVSVLLENGKPVKAGQDLYVVERAA